LKSQLAAPAERHGIGVSRPHKSAPVIVPTAEEITPPLAADYADAAVLVIGADRREPGANANRPNRYRDSARRPDYRNFAPHRQEKAGYLASEISCAGEKDL
jgi:hypothetical protein